MTNRLNIPPQRLGQLLRWACFEGLANPWPAPEPHEMLELLDTYRQVHHVHPEDVTQDGAQRRDGGKAVHNPGNELAARPGPVKLP